MKLCDEFASWWPTADAAVRVERDRHVEGRFARLDRLRLLTEAGFEPSVLPLEHSELDPGSDEAFVARKPV